MTLYEINNAILECVDMETGEIIDSDKLSELQMAFDEKIENVALWIKDLKAESEAIKKRLTLSPREEKSAKTRRRALRVISSMHLADRNSRRQRFQSAIENQRRLRLKILV